MSATKDFYKTPASMRYGQAVKDLFEGGGNYRLWSTLAWHELTQRYKRTWIGVGWIAVSFALFTGVKIFVFGALSKETTAAFSIHLILGYLVFRLLSSFVTGGSSVFVSAQSWIKSEPLPVSLHLFRLMGTNFLSFLFAAIPAVLATIFLGGLNLQFIASIVPSFLVYAISGISVAAIVATFCARYRDILHFVATVMQILYFVTPILWVAPDTGPRAIVAHYNPMTHFLEILRRPAIDGSIPYESWLIAGGYTMALAIIAFLVFGHSRSKIVFWL